MKNIRFPTLFLSHGGGPWPSVPEMRAEFANTEALFRGLSSTMPKTPKAILMISAHWEAPEFTVSTAQKPNMIYDYSGFPAHTYQLQYPAVWDPALANRVKDLLKVAEIHCAEDATRGFDHGAFVPLMLMYPEADVPVVTLSIKAYYSPLEHIQLGEALAPLRDEGVLIIGSGYTYHNMRGYGRPESMQASVEFETYLTNAVEETQSTRNAMLIDWQHAPFARQNHPREDHLVPLFIAAGGGGKNMGKRLLLDKAFGVVMANYQFG
jgi:aromatic ring-opening dioxygenase catalytic subunit (LigB family)